MNIRRIASAPGRLTLAPFCGSPGIDSAPPKAALRLPAEGSLYSHANAKGSPHEHPARHSLRFF